MGYDLAAIVGPEEILRKFARAHHHASVCPLEFGLALIPASDDLVDEIGSGFMAEFEKLTTSLAGHLRRISFESPIAYVEANYFGGIGCQNSIVWKREIEELKDIGTSTAINRALASLGVLKGTSHDEFEALKLGRHRHIEDWLIHAE